MTTKYIHINADDGIEVIVASIDRGYSVTLHDLESDETLPCALIFPTLEQAKAKADEIVNGKAATGEVVIL